MEGDREDGGAGAAAEGQKPVGGLRGPASPPRAAQTGGGNTRAPGWEADMSTLNTPFSSITRPQV